MRQLDDGQEGSCVLRVAIVKEIEAISKGAASFHGDVLSHLLHPRLGRVRVPGDPHLRGRSPGLRRMTVAPQNMADRLIRNLVT